MTASQAERTAPPAEQGAKMGQDMLASTLARAVMAPHASSSKGRHTCHQTGQAAHRCRHSGSCAHLLTRPDQWQRLRLPGMATWATDRTLGWSAQSWGCEGGGGSEVLLSLTLPT